MQNNTETGVFMSPNVLYIPELNTAKSVDRGWVFKDLHLKK